MTQENEIAQRECLRWKERYETQNKEIKIHKCIVEDKNTKIDFMKRQKSRVEWSDN